MSEELFPVEAVQCDSPRLRWIKRNHVVTFHSEVEPQTWFASFADGPVEDAAQWMFEKIGADGDSGVGEGQTEDDAIADAAKIWGKKLWNEEGA